MINLPIFKAGSAARVPGPNKGNKENCLIPYPEGTCFPLRPKKIIMAYRKNGDFGAISVTGEAAPCRSLKWRLGYTADRCSHYNADSFSCWQEKPTGIVST